MRKRGIRTPLPTNYVRVERWARREARKLLLQTATVVHNEANNKDMSDAERTLRNAAEYLHPLNGYRPLQSASIKGKPAITTKGPELYGTDVQNADR